MDIEALSEIPGMAAWAQFMSFLRFQLEPECFDRQVPHVGDVQKQYVVDFGSGSWW